MHTYTVTWTIEVEADYAEEAARKALAIQRDTDSIATVFEVSRPGLRTVMVDLTPEEGLLWIGSR